MRPGRIGYPDQADLLRHCREADYTAAAVMVVLGVAYAGFGGRMGRGLTVLNLAALGGLIGWWVARQAVGGSAGAAGAAIGRDALRGRGVADAAGGDVGLVRRRRLRRRLRRLAGARVYSKFTPRPAG